MERWCDGYGCHLAGFHCIENEKKFITIAIATLGLRMILPHAMIIWISWCPSSSFFIGPTFSMWTPSVCTKKNLFGADEFIVNGSMGMKMKWHLKTNERPWLSLAKEFFTVRSVQHQMAWTFPVYTVHIGIAFTTHNLQFKIKTTTLFHPIYYFPNTKVTLPLSFRTRLVFKLVSRVSRMRTINKIKAVLHLLFSLNHSYCNMQCFGKPCRIGLIFA